MNTSIDSNVIMFAEYIDFWLDNIHCYAVYDTDELMTLKSDLLNPPVMIIGTGMDKVEVINLPSKVCFKQRKWQRVFNLIVIS